MTRLSSSSEVRVRLLLQGFAAMAPLCIVAATSARAQSIQQTFTETPPGQGTTSETLNFSPNNPTSNINLNDPILHDIYTNNTVSGSSTITSNGITVANFSSKAGSSAVTIQIPSRGITQTFTGGDRATNYANALNYLQQQTPSLLPASTPAAPVINPISSPTNPANPATGNPLSLVGRMVGRDFRVSTGLGNFEPSVSAGNGRGASAALARQPNVPAVGGELSYASVAGTDLWSFTLPIDYTFYFADPRYSLTLDVPLTFQRIGNANVGQGSFGATFKFPATDSWSLGVGVRVGAVGSEDLMLGDIAYSGNISSQYRIYFGDYKLTIGNSVGVIQTNGFRVGGVAAGPSRSNVPISNGISLEGSLPFTILGKPASYEAYVVDTYFAGQQIAIRHYDEVGVNVGTRGFIGQQAWNNARLGLAYTVGRSFNMVSLRASYRF